MNKNSPGSIMKSSLLLVGIVVAIIAVIVDLITTFSPLGTENPTKQPLTTTPSITPSITPSFTPSKTSSITPTITPSITPSKTSTGSGTKTKQPDAAFSELKTQITDLVDRGIIRPFWSSIYAPLTTGKLMPDAFLVTGNVTLPESDWRLYLLVNPVGAEELEFWPQPVNLKKNPNSMYIEWQQPVFFGKSGKQIGQVFNIYLLPVPRQSQVDQELESLWKEGRPLGYDIRNIASLLSAQPIQVSKGSYPFLPSNSSPKITSYPTSIKQGQASAQIQGVMTGNVGQSSNIWLLVSKENSDFPYWTVQPEPVISGNTWSGQAFFGLPDEKGVFHLCAVSLAKPLIQNQLFSISDPQVQILPKNAPVYANCVDIVR